MLYSSDIPIKKQFSLWMVVFSFIGKVMTSGYNKAFRNSTQAETVPLTYLFHFQFLVDFAYIKRT